MSLSHALLGFLNYAPMTGYDLKKVFDDSVNFFWSAQTSQIYRELKTLERDGHIVSEAKPSKKGPERREYRITESGVSHLRNWLAEGHTDESMRNEFMMWVLFSSHIGTDELCRQIENKLKEYRKEYELLKIVEDKITEYVRTFKKDGEDFYWKIVLKRGCYDVDAKIRWAEDTLNCLMSRDNKG